MCEAKSVGYLLMFEVNRRDVRHAPYLYPWAIANHDGYRLCELQVAKRGQEPMRLCSEHASPVLQNRMTLIEF